MLQKMKLFHRILLVGIVPMLAVAYFAFVDVARLNDQRAQSDVVLELVEVSEHMGALMHELQRERGLSAGFIGSRGGKFGKELREQRQRTDQARQAMRESAGEHSVVVDNSPLGEPIKRFRAEYEKIAATRKQVDQFAIPVAEAAARYTGVVDLMLETLNELSSIGNSGAASRERSAYLLLLHAKERAGLERAMGATGFGAGIFHDPIMRKFAAYDALSRSNLSTFREFASAEDIRRLNAIEASAAAKEATALRDAAHRSVEPDVPLIGSADRWWAASTARIDAMHELENFVATEIVEGAEADLHHATGELSWAIGVFVILVIALSAVIWFVARSIMKPVSQVIRTMDDMSAGRLTGEPLLPEGNNELGKLGDTVRAFRVKLAQAEADRDEQEREREIQTQLIAGSIGSGLSALAEGDLTYRVNATLEGPLASLKADFNRSVESLEQLIGKSLRSIEEISASSREISKASEDLARRTESNAASLEETTAAVANLETQIRETARSASATSQTTQTADAAVREGRAVAADAAQSMQGVSESAKGIDAVIEGLDKIAFQTRVLAMNAAVEAGRAGEAGRGFAVVADLVAALAMRAEEEAGNAREQLTTTQEEIGRAVVAVDKVDGALDRITGNMDEVQQLVEAMSRANAAQANTIAEINVAMGQMDQSTQQNAAMVEETSAAARTLMTEAVTLRHETDYFTVSGRQGTVRAVQQGGSDAMHMAA
tara:strand:- start:31 stop:2193 length:2163 start_codon:yes stop_codon:yes gene_type:complete